MKAGLLRSSGLLALCVYFLALHHCLSYARADVVLSNAQLRATLVSQGGLINIVQTNDNSTKQFSLQTKIMTEMAQSTAVGSVTSFIREAYKVDSPVDSTFKGVRARTATMYLVVDAQGTSSANDTATMTYSIQVSMFQEDGFIKLGSKSLPVGTGQMGVTFMIVDWPFESYDNTLDLRVSVGTPSVGGSYTAPELFLFNGASWTFSSTAQIPAPYDSSPVSVSASNGDSGVDVTMEFYATNQITFDTVWSVESAGSSASRPVSFLSLFC